MSPFSFDVCSHRRKGRPAMTFMLAAVALSVGIRMLVRKRFDWTGQRVLVLGASRGLGLLLAHGFVRRGASVAIAARDPDELSNAKRAILDATGAHEQRVLALQCDVERQSDVESTVSEMRRHMGGVDVLVNVAGQIQVGPLESMTLQDFEHAMGTHFWGPLVASLSVLDEMRARRAGRIVNISSIGGLVAIPHLVPYVASKFALTGLTSGLRAELAKDGIAVTAIFPGLMRTGSSYRAFFKSRHRREHTWFALGAATPLTSIDARRAARRIIKAVERGEAHVILSWQAKLLWAFQAIAPTAFARLMATVARLLPAYGGIGKESRAGEASTSKYVPSAATRLIDRAALDLGELGPPRLDAEEGRS
jgi:short-subunit dehydrogenase